MGAIAGGCAAGVSGLVALVFSGGGGGGGEIVTPTVTAISPRQSTPAGGVAVTIEGRNFDRNTSVSFGGIRARSVDVRSSTEIVAITPPSSSGLALGLDGDVVDDDFRLLYTETNPDLRVKVARGSGGESFAPFYFMRPALRDVFRLECAAAGAGAQPEKVRGFGNRFERAFVFLGGDFFGFARPDAETRVEVVRVEGATRQRIATLREIDPNTGPDGPPGFWLESPKSSCPAGVGDVSGPPPAGDPHQGRTLSLRLPIQGDASLEGGSTAIAPGPIYVLRVVNRSGVDEIEFGYAPPFPPTDLVCTVEDRPDVEGSSKQVRLTWNDINEQNADGEPFSVVFVDRYDAALEQWVNLGIVPGGVGELVDASVDFRNYVYRVYGEFRGEKSPALFCEVAVAPSGISDLVLELGAEDGTGERGGEAIQGLLRSAGRASVLVRELEPSGEDAGCLLGPNAGAPAGSCDGVTPILDANAAKIDITWITASGEATIRPRDIDALASVLEYYRAIDRPGSIYLEGQHLIAALEQALRAGDSDSTGASEEGEVLKTRLIDERLRGLDFRTNLETFDTIDRIHVEVGGELEVGGRAVSELGWRAPRGGVTAHERDLLETELAPRGGRVLLSGSARREEGGGREVAAAFVVDRASGSTDLPSRTVISSLDLPGFTSSGVRRALVERYIEVLSGRVAGLDPPREEIRPVVSSFDPSSRDWNSRGLVELRGVNLSNVTGVLFGAQRADTLERASDHLLVRLPPVSVPGIVPVTLEFGDHASEPKETAAAGTFHLTTPPPVITELPLPRSSSASGGDLIAIRGENFTSPPDLRVLFGDVPAAIEASSRPDRLIVRAPRAASFPAGEEVQIEVLTDEGRHSATVPFTYEAVEAGPGGEDDPVGGALEVVTREALDAGGSELIVRGALLDDATVTVCGEALADVSVAPVEGSGFELRGTLPPGCGSCDVEAKLPGGTVLRSPDAFTYLSAELVDVTPLRAAPGDAIAFRVRNAGPDVALFLGAAELAIVDRVEGEGEVTIECLVPAGDPESRTDASAVNAGSACAPSTLAGAFEFVDPEAPRITSLSPSFGPDSGGTRVTLRGRGFERAQVTICGEPLLNQQLVQIGADFTITGTAPPGCGECDVVIRGPAGEDTLRGGFSYVSPQILDVAPRVSVPAGGGLLEVRATNVSAQTEVLLGDDVLEIIERGSGTITARIPAGAAGSSFDVAVRNRGASCEPSTLPGAFRYALPVLFLGEFSFDIAKSDALGGGSQLRGLLENAGLVAEVESGARVTAIDRDYLRSFAAVFFSKLAARSLSSEEAAALREYAEIDGGIVVLLGQHGLTEPAGAKGGDRSERNAIVDPFGVTFGGDLLADPRAHVAYDGCRSELCGPDTPGRFGDPDNGEEWAVLAPASGGALGGVIDDIANALDRLLLEILGLSGGSPPVDGLLFDWGQTIEIAPSGSTGFPRVSPLFVGTAASYGDRDAVFVAPSGACADGHFENALGAGDASPAGGVAGAAAITFGELDSGAGLILCVGDQEFLTNRFLADAGCGGTIAWSHQSFVANLAAFIAARAAP